MSRRPTVTQDLLRCIEDAAESIDSERKLPAPVVAALHQAGLFRALIPASLGGGELSLPEFLPLVRAIAAADASTAWCVAQSAVIAMTSVWLAPEIATEIWRDPEAAFANGPPLDCVADPVDDGYEVTGRWGFSSGCQHASIMVGAAPVSGSRRWIMAVFPKSHATFHDNWQVQGLRGTGSFEFSVDKLRVDRAWAANMAEPPQHPADLYKVPMGLVFAASFASVALGVARAGLDSVLALAGDKVPGYSKQVLKDDALVQDQLGEAEVRWRAAHAYLESTVASATSDLGHEKVLADDQRVALRMAGTHVIREAAAALEIGYGIAGSSGIYRDNPLHRPVQDMHVITQHVQGRRSHYAFAGRHLLGFPFQPGPLN